MKLRLSKPNTRTFLASATSKLPFLPKPELSIFFTPLPEEQGVAFEVYSIGNKVVEEGTYLNVDADGNLILGSTPYYFTGVKLRKSSPFKVGKHTVIIIDQTPWMEANSSVWQKLLLLLLLFLIAGLLAYFGSRSSQKDLGFLFYND